MAHSKNNNQVGGKTKGYGTQSCQSKIDLQTQQKDIETNQIEKKIVGRPWQKPNQAVQFLDVIMRVIGTQLIGRHTAKGTIGPIGLLPCQILVRIPFLGHTLILGNIGLKNGFSLQNRIKIDQ